MFRHFLDLGLSGDIQAVKLVKEEEAVLKEAMYNTMYM